MATRMAIRKLFGTVACLALTGVSLAFFIEEYGAYRLSRESDRGQYERLATGEVSLAPSMRARIAVLRACDEGQRGLFGQVQSTPSRRAVAEECLALAERAIEQAPTFSLAHYVVARSRLRLGQTEAFNRALALSRRTGPAEGWIAQRRFQLAVSGNSQLDGIGHATLAADAALLLRSPSGVDLVAHGFASTEAIRETILVEAETLPERDQRRFLSRLSDGRTAWGGG